MKTHVETCPINEKDGWGFFRIMGATFHPCPKESELLAFYERDLSSWKRARIERHLGECELCRESIALMVTLGREASQDQELGTVGEDVIRTQLARIVAIAGDDEVPGSATEPGRPPDFVPGRPRTLLGIPLSGRLMTATAALVFVLLAVPVVFWITARPSPSGEAMQALNQAVKTERRSEAMVSKLSYSRYNGVRGNSDSGDDLMFERAESKVRNSSSFDSRWALARVRLARNRGEDPQNALQILNQLLSSGQGAAEVWNDKGVAEFELSEYGQAIASFTEALQRSPDLPQALFNRALSEEAKERYEEARQDLGRFLSTNPEPGWRQEAEKKLAGLGGPLLSPR